MSRHKKWLALDNYKRKFFLKYFTKRLILRSIKRTHTISNSRRYIAYMHLIRMPRFSSANSHNARCIVSGRVWSTNKKTSLSRFELRRNVYNSILPGFRRASF